MYEGPMNEQADWRELEIGKDYSSVPIMPTNDASELSKAAAEGKGLQIVPAPARSLFTVSDILMKANTPWYEITLSKEDSDRIEGGNRTKGRVVGWINGVALARVGVFMVQDTVTA